MKSEQRLENYLLYHPDYWEYEDEKAEVERLRSLVKKERLLRQFHDLKSNQFKTRVGLAM